MESLSAVYIYIYKFMRVLSGISLISGRCSMLLKCLYVWVCYFGAVWLIDSVLNDLARSGTLFAQYCP